MISLPKDNEMISLPKGNGMISRSDGTRYEAASIQIFASNSNHGTIGAAFLDAAITDDLKGIAFGKRVLDIGCGAGNWCSVIAQCGAKSVDGFDIREEMVKLAKQATEHFGNVNIQVGDAANMPYNDDSFDVAISLFVTCNLSPEVFTKHFQELYRVLVPGGKAIFLVPNDSSHSRLYTKFECDPSTVQDHIAKILARVPKYPTTAQVTKAFKDADDILIACLAVDQKGDLFHATNIHQLTHGQPIWRITEVMVFPNFFYSDKSTITHMHGAGLHIDKIVNHFTEDKRVAYNNKKPDILLSRKYIQDPPVLVYHVSKSTDLCIVENMN